MFEKYRQDFIRSGKFSREMQGDPRFNAWFNLCVAIAVSIWVGIALVLGWGLSMLAWYFLGKSYGVVPCTLLLVFIGIVVKILRDMCR